MQHSSARVGQQAASFTVRGTYYRGEEAILYLRSNASIGDHVRLIPEPTNAADANAVAVYHEDTHVGYVPAERALELAQFAEGVIVSIGSNDETVYLTVRPLSSTPNAL